MSHGVIFYTNQKGKNLACIIIYKDQGLSKGTIYRALVRYEVRNSSREALAQFPLPIKLEDIG